MSSRRSSRVPVVAVVLAAGAVVAVAAGVVLKSRSASPSADPSTAASAVPSSLASLEALLAAPPGASAATDASEPRGQILSKISLTEAIGVARPLMANTVGRLDPGSALLALWASEHLTWDALESVPETSPALFRKDPDAERGKRFCVSGTVLEIRAEKSLSGRLAADRAMPLIERGSAAGGGSPLPEHSPPPAGSSGAGMPALDSLAIQGADFSIPGDGKVYVAIIRAKQDAAPEPPRGGRAQLKDQLVVEVIAARSTGAIVDGSEGRACGILTGVTLPAAGLGSSIPVDVTEHRLVGMFDLPENRAIRAP